MPGLLPQTPAIATEGTSGHCRLCGMCGSQEWLPIFFPFLAGIDIVPPLPLFLNDAFKAPHAGCTRQPRLWAN